MVFWTSGTTGKPKGIPQANGYMRRIMEVQEGMTRPNTLPLLITGPFIHPSLFFLPLLLLFVHSSSLVFIKSHRSEAKPEEILTAIDRHRPYKAIIIPFQMSHLATIPQETIAKLNLDSLTSIFTAGSPMFPAVEPIIKNMFPNLENISTSYGTAELGYISSSPDLKSIGKPQKRR